VAEARTTGEERGFSIRLGNDISAVEEGRRALSAYLENFPLDPVVVNRIEVILEELVSNVARHAKCASYIAISADYTDSEIALLVEDDGDPYNPLERTAPAPYTDVASATLGGQGIPLINSLSRFVHYDRIGEANRVGVIVSAH